MTKNGGRIGKINEPNSAGIVGSGVWTLADQNIFESASKWRGSYVTAGLVAAWDAKNPLSYSGTGSSWSDISGNGLTLTMNGSLTWNSAGYFTNWSTSNFWSQNSNWASFVPTGTSARTIIAYANRSGGSGTAYEHVVHYGTANSQQAYGIAVQSGNLNDHRWATSNFDGAVDTSSNLTLSVRYDSSTYTNSRFGINTTYTNGSTISSQNTGSTTFRVGSRIDVPTETWPSSGRIYAVFIYNRVLSDAEMTAMHTYFSSRFG